MFNFVKSLLGGGSCLGVDIGTTSIKIVEITGGKQPQLVNYGILESYSHLTRENSAIQTSSLKLAERETAELIKMLLKQAKFKTREAIASIPAFSAFITLLEIPEMSEADTMKSLQFQIPQYIPMPLTEVNIDWIKVGQREDESGFVKQQILLISVPNEQIAKYKEIFKSAGLKLTVLELESLSLIRALTANDPTATLIVDLGGRATNILISQKGFLKCNLQTDFAGASLTQAIASGLGINMRRAEELKKQKGILLKDAEYELSTLTLPFLDAIISEAKRAKVAYEKSPDLKVERIILTGSGANTIGLGKYFEEQIGLPTVIGNPFLKIGYPRGVEPLTKELAPVLSAAIGLGIRNFL